MIRLTRLRNSEPLYLNPDHFERLDDNHDTTVHMTSGTEYVVTEDAEAIVGLIVDFRASVLVRASYLQSEPGA